MEKRSRWVSLSCWPSPSSCCLLPRVCQPRQSSCRWLVRDPWWRHQMETFSALLALCAGNSLVPVNSPHKGQSRAALMFSLICVWINGWVNNREPGDLRRHRSHYDVNVMRESKIMADIEQQCNKVDMIDWKYWSLDKMFDNQQTAFSSTFLSKKVHWNVFIRPNWSFWSIGRGNNLCQTGFKSLPETMMNHFTGANKRYLIPINQCCSKHRHPA